MRIFVAGVAAVLVIACAAYQALATVALRERAAGPAWVALVPARLASGVDALGPGIPLPPALRLVLARKALAAGDTLRAQRDAEALPPSPDRLALRGELAQARGDVAAASEAELAAGDLSGLQREVDALVARRDLDHAVALERAMVARLARDRTQEQALAEADFELGLLEEREAWRYAPGSAIRRAHERASYRAYARAVELAPLAERYLLGFANQALNVGLYDAAAYDVAATAFARARLTDPTSAEPLAGLGDLALRRGDRAAAAQNLARARALDPDSAAVQRLAQALQH